MAAIQDAVGRLATPSLIPILLMLMVILLAPALNTVSAYVEEPPPELRIYYDRRQPANFLHEYKVRVLVVEVPYGVSECWERLPNGTVVQLCPPVKDALVRVWYEEMKEMKEARTGGDGVASVDFRLWTMKATFKVEAYSEKGSIEVKIYVNANPWLAVTYVFFAGMVSSLVFAVKRGLW
jgi:hypothetical protein